MADGLWEGGTYLASIAGRVLILVLMADGLWVICTRQRYLPWCLNPCSNGRWSLRRFAVRKRHTASCLNPCSNGRWSLRPLTCALGRDFKTGLNPCSNGRWSLRPLGTKVRIAHDGLNPCSNGRWSLSHEKIGNNKLDAAVLILVLMADGLWEQVRSTSLVRWCLNPCSNGRWSLRAM